MANNTSPQAITFSNTKLRPVIDSVCSTLASVQTLLALYQAQGIASLIPNDSDLIQDGATPAPGGTADGRPPLSDAAFNTAVANLSALNSWFAANGGAMQAFFVGLNVNGRSVI